MKVRWLLDTVVPPNSRVSLFANFLIDLAQELFSTKPQISKHSRGKKINDVRSDIYLDDQILKIWLACSILPQRPVLQKKRNKQFLKSGLQK